MPLVAVKTVPLGEVYQTIAAARARQYSDLDGYLDRVQLSHQIGSTAYSTMATRHFFFAARAAFACSNRYFP